MAEKFDNKQNETSGGQALDPAAGANAYLESASDGDIDLDDLLGPEPTAARDALVPDPDASAPPSQKPESGSAAQAQPSLPGFKPGAANNVPPPDTSSDFLSEALKANAPGANGALSGPAAAVENKPQGRLTVVFITFKTFGLWLLEKIKSIPPLDDIFDHILFSLGLRRRPVSMLRRANTLAHKGRLAEAVNYYREYQTLKPLSVPGYDGLGRTYFRMGLTEEANREFTIADSMERILHNRDDIEAAAALATAFLERKQGKISISLIEPVLIAHFYTPGNAELLKAMGQVYSELRANKKMHQVYTAGLAQHPEDYEFYICKGEAEIRLGNLSEGERLIRWGRLMKKLKENPKDANAKMAMGEMFLKENKTEEGMKALKEAASLLPENTGIRWRLFNLYQKDGNYESSLKYLKEIVALEPTNNELQYRLAEFYRRNKHREEAVEIYRRLIDQAPRDPRPHALLGEILTEMGSFEEGQKMTDLAQTLEAGLKENPNHIDTVRFMKYLFNQGQTKEANQWLERGLAQWPYHGELVLTKAKLLYKEYRYKDALDLLKRLTAVKSDIAEPHIWIAMCHQRLGDNMAALAEAQLATRLAPKSYTAHKVLGDILKEQKKLSQANAAYEVAEMMRLGKK